MVSALNTGGSASSNVLAGDIVLGFGQDTINGYRRIYYRG